METTGDESVKLPDCMHVRVWAGRIRGNYADYMYTMISDMDGCRPEEMDRIIRNAEKWLTEECSRLFNEKFDTIRRAKKGNGWKIRMKIISEDEHGKQVLAKWIDGYPAPYAYKVRLKELSEYDVVYGSESVD